MSLLALYCHSVNKPRLVELQSPVVCSAVGLEGAGEMWDKSSALLQFFSSTLWRIFLVLPGCLLWLLSCAVSLSQGQGRGRPALACRFCHSHPWKSFSHAMLGLCYPVKREQPC